MLVRRTECALRSNVAEAVRGDICARVAFARAAPGGAVRPVDDNSPWSSASSCVCRGVDGRAMCTVCRSAGERPPGVVVPSVLDGDVRIYEENFQLCDTKFLTRVATIVGKFIIDRVTTIAHARANAAVGAAGKSAELLFCHLCMKPHDICCPARYNRCFCCAAENVKKDDGHQCIDVKALLDAAQASDFQSSHVVRCTRLQESLQFV